MASHRLATGKIHPSRLHNFPDAPKKSRRPRPTVKADDASDVTIGALRNSIRNLERLLQHNENLPANVRAEKERALESYKIDLEEADETRRSKKIIKKYHGVRFFGMFVCSCVNRLIIPHQAQNARKPLEPSKSARPSSQTQTPPTPSTRIYSKTFTKPKSISITHNTVLSLKNIRAYGPTPRLRGVIVSVKRSRICGIWSRRLWPRERWTSYGIERG